MADKSNAIDWKSVWETALKDKELFRFNKLPVEGNPLLSSSKIEQTKLVF